MTSFLLLALPGPGRWRHVLNTFSYEGAVRAAANRRRVQMDMEYAGYDCIVGVLVNEFRLGKVFNDESTRIFRLTLAAESLRLTDRF